VACPTITIGRPRDTRISELSRVFWQYSVAQILIAIAVGEPRRELTSSLSFQDRRSRSPLETINSEFAIGNSSLAILPCYVTYITPAKFLKVARFRFSRARRERAGQEKSSRIIIMENRPRAGQTGKNEGASNRATTDKRCRRKPARNRRSIGEAAVFDDAISETTAAKGLQVFTQMLSNLGKTSPPPGPASRREFLEQSMVPEMAPAGPRYARVPDLQRLCGLKRGTVYNLLKSGKILGCLLPVNGKVSGVRVVDLDSVFRFIQGHMEK
jgi:hypothetical protein